MRENLRKPSLICNKRPIYIYIESTYLYKGHLNNTDFILARLPKLVEHQTSHLRDVGSNPTVGKNFSFCILSLSTRC